MYLVSIMVMNIGLILVNLKDMNENMPDVEKVLNDYIKDKDVVNINELILPSNNVTGIRFLFSIYYDVK